MAKGRENQIQAVISGTSGARLTASEIAHVSFLNMLVAWIEAGHALNKVFSAAARPLSAAGV